MAAARILFTVRTAHNAVSGLTLSQAMRIVRGCERRKLWHRMWPSGVGRAA